MNPTHLLIGITGSAMVLGMPAYLLHLKKKFSNIKIIMTQSAQRFMPRESLALLSAPIITDLFPVSNNNHIVLAEWAHLLIILPATAHILAASAQGFADSLLTTTILSHQYPILFFPSMNDVMWSQPSTKRNVALLREYGHKVIDPLERDGYEVAARRVERGGYVPSPDELTQILESEIAERQKEFFYS